MNQGGKMILDMVNSVNHETIPRGQMIGGQNDGGGGGQNDMEAK